MINRLVVSTECPACGAPLDFEEGSNAVCCRHCRSNLLVTGRKQVLSYCLSSKVDGRYAATQVMFAHRDAGRRGRVVKAQLYFVPYYRLTGHDLRWERAGLEDGTEGGSFRNRWALRDLLGDATLQVSHGDAVACPSRSGERDAAEWRIELRDRYVEKSLVACQLGSAGLLSLGIKPAVLQLELFRRGAAGQEFRVVAADMSPETAEREGLKAVSVRRTLYRTVIGRVLSIVYHPYWVVEVDRGRTTVLTVVDAVTDDVVKLDCPVSLYDVLDRAPQAEMQVAAFRPMACPNCGWDLPVRPNDVIFRCAPCGGAWQITGSDLRPEPYQTADVPSGEGSEPITYLPFWVLDAHPGRLPPQRFLVPAFRYRRLKFLVDLARALVKKSCAYSLTQEERTSEYGCFYDQDDALRLAEFVYAGLDATPSERIRMLEGKQVAFGTPVLTWFPYRLRHEALIDPFTGRAFYQAMLG